MISLKTGKKIGKSLIFVFALLLCFFMLQPSIHAADGSGESMYRYCLNIMNDKSEGNVVYELNTQSRKLNWKDAKTIEFEGNLRHLKSKDCKGRDDNEDLYLLREITGKMFVLSLPDDPKLIEANASSDYAGLEKMLEDKMVFKVKVVDHEINGKKYTFAMFDGKPTQLLFDKIFKIASVIMLFSVMIGMGMTLTMKDFSLIFKNPKGMIVGTLLQFGLMPLVAVAVGHLFGYYEAFPFVYVGTILVTATPGGATSNLMTHFAKGDLALSISLTSTATALSLFITPLILAIYCTNVPEVNMPVGFIMVVIFVMVLLPLLIGMFVRHKWHLFAQKAIPYFSILGMIAVLFMIIAGIFGNIEKFTFTLERYGFTGYVMIFVLTFSGIFVGIIFPKLFGISNFQTRAISMELGIRNVTLGMVLALLIQDHMGDFNSEMFIVNAAFALAMYVTGILAIFVYKKLLPVTEAQA